jgi:putative membrane protein
MKIRAALGIVAKGFCMGAADVVPGVSGGTMAFILGIYTRFIDAIKSFDLVWAGACLRLDWRSVVGRPDFQFLLPLVVGIFSALLFFTHVVPLPSLLVSQPELVYGLFFGLISGSIVVLFARFDHLYAGDVVPLVIGLLAGAAIVTAVPADTPDSWWFIFVSGALAICAMVVPGISGSFVLLVLGKYAYVLDAIGHFRFSVIVPFAAGAALGLFAFTRVLSWILHHYERQSLVGISGILIASLWVIWPFQERVYTLVRGKSRLADSSPLLPQMSIDTLYVVACAAIGFVIVIVLQRLAGNARLEQN